MAAIIGHIGEFKPEVENITTYLERIEVFLVANDIANEKKSAVLLSCIGSKTYGVMKNLCAPDLPASKDFATLCTTLKSHYDPKPSFLAQRCTFKKRRQLPTESVTEFIAELRRLALHCQFGTNLDDSLRDQFIHGLKSEAILKRLLSEETLTLKRAVELATIAEAAARDAKSFGNNSEHSSIKNLSSDLVSCKHCGRSNHPARECRFKSASCHNCGKTGHISTVCRQPRHSKNKSDNKGGRRSHRRQSQSTKCITSNSSMNTQTSDGGDKEADGEELSLFTVRQRNSPKPIVVDVQINGRTVPMEVDTGAAVTIMSQTTWKTLFPDLSLQKSSIVLRTYTAEQMSVVGQREVTVSCNDQTQPLIITVVAGNGSSLLGRNWLEKLRLNWHQISNVSTVDGQLGNLLDEFQDVFKDELGMVRSYQATLQLKEGAQPKFFKPRNIPFAVRDAVGEELDRLEAAGILEKVSHAEWAAPIVAVPKKDGRFRICGDYKVTINPVLETDQYPLPTPDELFATLVGGKKFTKLDLSQAYAQIRLDDTSRGYVTINTHKGLYRYTRLPYGVASAPAVFQRFMESVLEGIPYVGVYIDDIIVTGKTDAEHLATLKIALTRLQDIGLRIKRPKCRFMQTQIEFLGHVIDQHGISPAPGKVDAVVNAPRPKNLTELRAFLGLLNYYGKFLPDLATKLHPLNKLLKKQQEWKWTRECDTAFNWAKQALTSAQVLVHYNPELPIRVAADASAYGIGAVLSHVLGDGSERPIAYASRTLSASEKNYSQIEKEALGLIYAVKKFHQYIYGRQFTLVTDHKPLLVILGPKKGIPPLAAARMQRWSFLLSANIVLVLLWRGKDLSVRPGWCYLA